MQTKSAEDWLEYFIIDRNFPDIVDSILRKLKFEDLINLGFVNKTYNQFIADKIKFVVEPDKQRHLKVTRRYRHIKFKNDLSDLDFILKFLHSDVESIEFHDCFIDFWADKDFEGLQDLFDKQNFQLDHLKKLDIKSLSNVAYPLVQQILFRSKNLKFLSISLTKCELQLLSDLTSPSCGFQLKSFKFSVFTDYNFQMPKPEIHDTLLKHFKTLQQVVLDVWIDQEIINLMLSMDNIKRIEIYEMGKWNRGPDSEIKWKNVEFVTNNSIKCVKVQDLRDDITFLECIINACAKVETIIVSKITKENLKFFKRARKTNKRLKMCDEYHEALNC